MNEGTTVGRFLAAKAALLTLLGLRDTELDMMVGLQALDELKLAELNALFTQFGIDPELLVNEIHHMAPETNETIVCDGSKFVTLPDAKLVNENGTFKVIGERPTLMGYTRARVGDIIRAIGKVIDYAANGQAGQLA